MINIIQNFLTENRSYKNAKAICDPPKGVMIHSTGVNNPNISRYVHNDPNGLIGINHYNNHWNNTSVSKSVHYFIGKLADGNVGIVQTMPLEFQTWHGGKEESNGYYISFEICEDLTDPEYMEQARKSAVELCVYLHLHLSVKMFISHSEGYKLGIASNHADVDHWCDMDDFRIDIQNKIKELENVDETEWEKEKQNAQQWVNENGIINGDMESVPTRGELAVILARYNDYLIDRIY